MGTPKKPSKAGGADAKRLGKKSAPLRIGGDAGKTMKGTRGLEAEKGFPNHREARLGGGAEKTMKGGTRERRLRRGGKNTIGPRSKTRGPGSRRFFQRGAGGDGRCQRPSAMRTYPPRIRKGQARASAPRPASSARATRRSPSSTRAPPAANSVFPRDVQASDGGGGAGTNAFLVFFARRALPPLSARRPRGLSRSRASAPTSRGRGPRRPPRRAAGSCTGCSWRTRTPPPCPRRAGLRA